MTSRTTKKPAKASSKRNGAMPDQQEANGSATHQNNGELPTVVEPSAKPPVEKDELGRFLPGNNGGPGRPLGSKNKLVEDFLADFHAAWQESGADALRRMVKDEPSAFVRAAVQLMPKDVLVEARGAGLVVVETPAAIRALLEALPDLGVMPTLASAASAVEASAASAAPSDGEGGA